ncbi:hypothetical protein RHGRI_016018 [Rhododendron griersonianum]|uniref:Uncharacterized protein n=1 Tax=Rhododendron griersonianum TaxID=479676 RepID=A0AAV6JS29_9ERIC|nr:hypothetical protein RHGRI_016018 [Rhododendron griersonianum]
MQIFGSAIIIYGFPIYSAKAVRFRMRHPRSPIGIGSDSGDEFDAGNESTDSTFIWTYISLEFPMAQVRKSMQKFNLPEPVLCIGGIEQVELLGMVQKQEMDSLYYICLLDFIAHASNAFYQHWQQMGGVSIGDPISVELLEGMECYKMEREEGFRNSNKAVKMLNHLVAKKSRMI